MRVNFLYIYMFVYADFYVYSHASANAFISQLVVYYGNMRMVWRKEENELEIDLGRTVL